MYCTSVRFIGILKKKESCCTASICVLHSETIYYLSSITFHFSNINHKILINLMWLLLQVATDVNTLKMYAELTSYLMQGTKWCTQYVLVTL